MKAIEKIKKFKPCLDAVDWLQDRTVEQMVKDCPKGEWLLWLADKMSLDIRSLTLAKARCAKTVIHLMSDERSVNAVRVAERFGMGLATREELDSAAKDTYAVDSTEAAVYAAAAADAAAYTAADAAADAAAYTAAYAAAAADAAAYTAAYAAADAARMENERQTADICREIFGEWLINELNK